MKEWKDKMISTVRATWEREYRGHSPSEPEAPKQLDFLDRHLRKAQVEAESDPFTSYIKGTPVEFATGSDEDLIAWWMREANPWKPLRQQALDLLSIPAMSAEVDYTRPQPPRE
jgi:hypothetical protein